MKSATYRSELRALLGEVKRIRGADPGPHRGGLTHEEREFWRRMEAVLLTACQQDGLIAGYHERLAAMDLFCGPAKSQ